MDQGRVAVDVDSAVRDWARDQVDSANRRVFFGANDSVVDQIVLHRVGGADDNVLYQFDCWASNRAAAAALATDLETAADNLARYETDDVVLHGATWESTRWFPDPETDRPRFVVDVTFTATSTASAGS